MRRTTLPAARQGLLFLAVMVVSPGTAAAQQEEIGTPYRWIERGTRVGIFAGYVFADRGDLQMGPGPTAMIGARLRTRLSSPLSLELNLAFGSSDRYVIDPRLDTYPEPVDTVGLDWMIAQLNLQLALTGARSLHRFQPYILLGGGIMLGISEERSEHFIDPTESAFRFELGTAPALTIGLGAEWDISSKLGLGFEVRDNIWRIKAPDAFFLPDVLAGIVESGAPAPKESEWLNNIELTAGLYYYF
jgi:hypothetical protein